MNDKEYKEYEKQVEKHQVRNEKLFVSFKKWLEYKSLKPKTIENHISNIDFFANNFLLRYEIIPIEKGTTEIGSFLGGFFIRKAMWASKAAINENIASFKKFYTFLYEIELITKEELKEMKEFIKEEKEEWIEALETPTFYFM